MSFFIGHEVVHQVVEHVLEQQFDIEFRSAFHDGVQELISQEKQSPVLGVDLVIAAVVTLAPDKLHDPGCPHPVVLVVPDQKHRSRALGAPVNTPHVPDQEARRGEHQATDCPQGMI
jgi:hypothetical protein